MLLLSQLLAVIFWITGAHDHMLIRQHGWPRPITPFIGALHFQFLDDSLGQNISYELFLTKGVSTERAHVTLLDAFLAKDVAVLEKYYPQPATYGFFWGMVQIGQLRVMTWF